MTKRRHIKAATSDATLPPATELDMRPWVENWYRQTDNPTYAWEALMRSFDSGETPPGWAMPYFGKAAKNIYLLSIGRDYRSPKTRHITPREATKLVSQALGFVAPRTKNAFARRASDSQISKAAAEAITGYPERVAPLTTRAVVALSGSKNISIDRATRLIAKGKKLNTPK